MWEATLLFVFFTLYPDCGENVLSTGALSSIVNDMYGRFNQNKLKERLEKSEFKGEQYSIALLLSKQDCSLGKLDSSIPADFKTLRDVIANGAVFQDGQLVGAIPKKQKSCTGTEYTSHAEYRVLSKLQTIPQSECLIIYTHFSPCTAKCINSWNRNNILHLLDSLKQDAGYKALVFSKVFHWDFIEKTYDLLKQVKDIQIYCCSKKGKSSSCTEFDRNGGLSQHCLAV